MPSRPCAFRSPKKLSFAPPNGKYAIGAATPMLTPTIDARRVLRELARRLAARREDRRRVRVGMRLHHRDRLVERLHRADRRDRAEDLLVADRHLRRYVVEHRRADEVAVRPILDPRLSGRRPAASRPRRRPSRCSRRTRSRWPALMTGPMVTPGCSAVADLQRPRRCDHAIARFAVRVADRHQHAAGQAALAGAAVERLGDDADRAVEVGVRHDDDEVLRAAERLRPFAGVRRALVDVPARPASIRRTTPRESRGDRRSRSRRRGRR